MTNYELAMWLQKTPGEIYVPAAIPGGDTVQVRAHKGDFIALLLKYPNARTPWDVYEYETDRKRRAWFRIILSPAAR